MLQMRHLQSDRPSRKLDYRKLGPFMISQVINEQAYQLELPETMHIHPVFHVSLLEPYFLNTLQGQVEVPLAPIGQINGKGEDEREWEVEEILKSRIR